jgi:hypothetical protein
MQPAMPPVRDPAMPSPWNDAHPFHVTRKACRGRVDAPLEPQYSAAVSATRRPRPVRLAGWATCGNLSDLPAPRRELLIQAPSSAILVNTSVTAVAGR